MIYKAKQFIFTIIFQEKSTYFRIRYKNFASKYIENMIV